MSAELTKNDDLDKINDLEDDTDSDSETDISTKVAKEECEGSLFISHFKVQMTYV